MFSLMLAWTSFFKNIRVIGDFICHYARVTSQHNEIYVCPKPSKFYDHKTCLFDIIQFLSAIRWQEQLPIRLGHKYYMEWGTHQYVTDIMNKYLWKEIPYFVSENAVCKILVLFSGFDLSENNFSISSTVPICHSCQQKIADSCQH